MAFTQNNGNPVSFIGTDGRDTIVLTNGTPITGVTNGSGTWTGGPAFIDGLGDNDLITFNGNSGSVTVNGGSGNDQITLNGSGDVGQFTSGQIFAGADNDTVIYNNLVFPASMATTETTQFLLALERAQQGPASTETAVTISFLFKAVSATPVFTAARTTTLCK
ncbi:hypothetical protein [Synechococcus sp. CBW1107]|uniref:hypothetical protein n=1 Tax=Synechococcus sp. CBW1107 TaxID=2789857 RepID=UPI002AD367A9|nr:hypothetical protein [Synechococcus sp. CBW1107]CAK6696068.1 hypothetical protein ICNINCKA_01951 [Synechococcus sp. CBW1107]